MSYLYYLDNRLYDNPAEDRTLSTRIKRNSNLNGLLVTQEAKLEFQGVAYAYLFNKFFDGLCTEVEVEIWEDCQDVSFLVYDGIIKISDIKIDFQKCVIETSIEDRSFFSYINNNKSIKVPLGVETLSKTGEVIPELELYNASFFSNCSGAFGANVLKGWRVFDVLQFILNYITDNRIELVSSLLTGGEDESELFLTQGISIRPSSGLPAPQDVKLSFKDIYNAVHKLFNISFRIEPSTYSYSRAVLRIEKQDYFYATEGNFEMSDVKDLQILADGKEVFSSVKIGSTLNTEFSESPGTCALLGITTIVESPLFGWSEEQFHMFGQCNEDNELDLAVPFQIASNVIEDVHLYISPDYDDDLFLIEIDTVDTGALTCSAVRYNFYGQTTPPHYFNLGLNNSNVLLRRSGYIHNNVQQFLQSGDNEYRVTRSNVVYTNTDGGICVYDPIVAGTCINVFLPYEYDDDTTPGNFNNGGSYDIVAYEYTCPVDGDYTFDHTLFYTPFGCTKITSNNPVLHPHGTFNEMDVIMGFTNITTPTSPTQQQQLNILNTNPNTLTASSTIPCTAGDVIQAYVSLRFKRHIELIPGLPTKFGITVSSNSRFACTSTPSTKDAVQVLNTELFKALLFKFEYPLGGDDFRELLDDPTQLITITSNGETFRGWIDDLKYNHWENKAQITLRSNAISQDS